MPWEQLSSIIEQQREGEREDKREPPVACPNDGAILQVRDDGERNCPMGDYRWP